jgi:acetyltransferase-like isoleucine patch superfamily enzyme
MIGSFQPPGKSRDAVRGWARLPRAVVARFRDVSCALTRTWLSLTVPGLSLETRGRQRLHPSTLLQISDGGGVRMAARIDVARGVELTARRGQISIGGRTFIGPWVSIVARESVTIGCDCLIAERVTIRDQDHEIHGRPDRPIAQAGFQIAPVAIGDGAWIGAGAVILKGVTIGKGAVVAANAVVTRDVADHEIVGGVPARRLGMRKDHDA